MALALILGNPDSYVEFCKEHPVDLWPTYAHETIKGGKGDIKSPTPAVDAFFRLFASKGGLLPTQQEYVEYCWGLPGWQAWLQTYPPYIRDCFWARVQRQFYVSCIDSLHVWALLGTRYAVNGQQVFERCVLDTFQDVVLKTDLIVYRKHGGMTQHITLALHADTHATRQALAHKAQYRGGIGHNTIVLPLRIAHKARIGGKCWYHWPNDFKPLWQQAEQLQLDLPHPSEESTP